MAIKIIKESTLWTLFSIFIRLRDTDADGYGKCFTCPRIIFWRKGDCGHGIGRQHKATKYNEKNNHIQCSTCNAFDGGMREVYKKEMDRRYGAGTWELMELAARKATKIGSFEFSLMYIDYKKKVAELMKTKNFTL